MDPEPKHYCQCCATLIPESEVNTFEPDSLWERIFPGELVPSGTCTRCGALTLDEASYTWNRATTELLGLVDKLTASYENMLLHHAGAMPAEDVRTRRELLERVQSLMIPDACRLPDGDQAATGAVATDV